MCRELKYLLQSLKYNNGNAQHMILQNIAAIIQKATRDELLCLLGVLNTTNDIELKVHMISLCCVYLLSNNKDIEVFITNNYMYVSIENILSKNLPKKTTVVLNFLTLLLHADNEVFAARKLSLGTHVRHMIRISGCLATMADFFIRGILYQDTWGALCQCLAETCCSCEINQSYCSRLIPKCVQVCTQGNLDAPPLLFSLLNNHERNIRMFIQINGMCLFSRNLLQYIPYLQLLDAVIQTSLQAAIIANKSGSLPYVREILKSQGPYSQMGQWATVILYRADSIIKENKQINGSIERNVSNNTNKNDLGINHNPHCDNTTQLFRNIIKEIIQWQPAVDIAHNNAFTDQNKTQISYKEKDRVGNDRQGTFDNSRGFQKCINEDNGTSFNFQPKTKWQESRDDDLMISFLNEFDQHSKCNEYNNVAEKEKTTKKINSSDSLYDFNQNVGGNISRHTTRQYSPFDVKIVDTSNITRIKYFKPEFMSTPKKKMNKSKEGTTNNIKINLSDMVKNKAHRTNKVNFHKIQKSIVNKELRNKSISFRLFNAINNSCTTIVNKVKNIFTLNKDSSESKCTISHTKSNMKQRHYSFTKFMHERDSCLIENRSKSNMTCKSITNSCSTCDDTKELKQKLIDNKHLKHTIKKLTLGINLYGCDFKKISKVMWPQESYMTPKVLYNLYRKLIRK